MSNAGGPRFARECHFDSGYVSAYPHVAADGIVRRDQDILLIRRGPDKIEGGKWALPGGYVELDQGVPDTVSREALEEAGVQAANWQLFMILDGLRRNDPDKNVSFVFIGEATEEGDPTQTDDPEVTGKQWFDINGLPPGDEIAFDHADVLLHYRRHLAAPYILPVFLSQAPPLPEDL